MFDFHYQHAEESLAQFYEVRDRDRKAFRARIRHLRNLGIPPIRKPGRGFQISYTTAQLHELFLALEMTDMGISPTHIQAFMERHRSRIERWCSNALADKTQSYHLAVLTSMFGGQVGERRIDRIIAKPWDRLQTDLKREKKHHTVIELSEQLTRLHQILDRVFVSV